MTGRKPFRQRASRSLDRRERWIVGLTSLHLFFLPWALGAMHLAAQLSSLGFSLATLALAVLPRTRVADDGDGPVRYLPHRRLFRSVLFWAGLGFLALVVCQGLNYAWDYKADSRGWWLVRVEHLGWLPSGIRAPFDRMNAWRYLIITASAWCTMLTVLVGFTRRRSVLFALHVVALNGALQALLGLAQQMAGMGRIYGYYLPSNDRFFASFIYKNHAAAYLNLACGVALALGAWYQRRQARRMERSSPAPVLYILAISMVLASVLSLSRAGTLALGLFLAGVFLVAGWRMFFRKDPGSPPNRAIQAAFLAIALASAVFVVRLVDFKDVKLGFKVLVDGSPGRMTIDRRLDAAAGTWDMFTDRWLTGWGGGGFRYYFPEYARLRPSIYTEVDGKRLFWEYAHNDILQTLAEVGIVGGGLILAGLGSVIVALGWGGLGRKPPVAILLAACSMTLAHAWMDFVLSNPAVLVTCAAVFLLACKWAEIEAAPVPALAGEGAGIA